MSSTGTYSFGSGHNAAPADEMDASNTSSPPAIMDGVTDDSSSWHVADVSAAGSRGRASGAITDGSRRDRSRSLSARAAHDLRERLKPSP